MTVEEAIKLSKTRNIFASSSTRAAQQLLRNNEEVKYAINANVLIEPISGKLNKNSLSIKNKINGVFVVTNRRIFFCSNILGNKTEKELSIDKIQSIDSQYNILLGSGQLRIKGITEMFVIDCNLKVIDEIKSLINCIIYDLNNNLDKKEDINNIEKIKKYKELFDCGAISQEEFEQKKKQLLNSQHQSTKKENTQTRNVTINNKKNNQLKEIVIAIMAFIMILIIGICNIPTLKKQLQDEVGLTSEKALQMEKILNDCGISSGTITRNSKLDTENGKAYNISINSNRNIAVMKIKGDNLYSLRMIKIDNKDNEQVLYKDNKKIASLSDFIKSSESVESPQQQLNKELLTEYSVSFEDTDKIIKECGFSNYTLEYVGEENGIHYFIIRQENLIEGEKIAGGLNVENGQVITIDYANHILYEKGQFLHKVEDFILTNDEKYNYIDSAKEAVKTQLNYPNTAKFPWLYDEYYVTYTDKNNVTVKGEVTASNAFNVPLTYTFEVTFTNNTVTNVNMY